MGTFEFPVQGKSGQHLREPTKMSLLTSLIVCCMAAAAHGQTVTPEPARCCQPRQWQGVLYGVGSNVYSLTGNVVPVDTYTYMAYDYDRKKIGLETHFRQANNTERIVRSLLDYGTDTMYLSEEGKCTIAKIGEGMQEPCVPDNAKFISTGVMGYGNELVTVNTWEIGMPGSSGNVIKRSYTNDACIPFAEATYGTYNGASSNLVQLVANFSPSHRRPKCTEPPSRDYGMYCREREGTCLRKTCCLQLRCLSEVFVDC